MAEETEMKFHFTSKGRQISAAILAGKDKIEFTKAAASIDIHINDTDEDIANIIDLDNKKQVVDITDTVAVDDNVVQIPIKFEKNKITEDYQLNTVGIYANYQGKEVLYAFGALRYPLFMHHTDDSSVLKLYTYITVGTVDNVVIKTNDAENITREEFAEAMTGKANVSDVDNELNKKVDKADYEKDKKQLEDGIKDAGKVDSVNLIKPDSNSKDVSLTSENIPHYNSSVKQTLDSLNNGKASKQDVIDAKQYADNVAKTAQSNAEQYADNKVEAAGKVKSVNGGTGDVKVGGTNLFIKSTLQHGWLDHNQTDNGGISNSEADYHTDYIYVADKENFTLTFYQPSNYLKGHYFNAQIDLCDGNKAWLASVNTGSESWGVQDSKIYLQFSTVPNTAYIRVSVNYGNDGEMIQSHTKLEYGTILTDWSPAPEDIVTDKDFKQFKQDNQNALNGKATPDDVAQAESRANAHAESVAGAAQSNAKNYTSSQLANYYNKQQTDTALNQKAPSIVDGHDVAHLLHNFLSLWGGDAEREPIINGNSTHFFDQVELVGKVLTTSGFFATDSNNFTFPIRKADGSYSNEQLATALKLISECAYANKAYADNAANKAKSDAETYAYAQAQTNDKNIKNVTARVTTLENREYTHDSGNDAAALTYSKNHPSVIVFGD